jgi:hypothetical protein
LVPCATASSASDDNAGRRNNSIPIHFLESTNRTAPFAKAPHIWGAGDAERQSFDRLDLSVDLHAVSGPLRNIRCYCVWLKAYEDKSFALAIDLPVMEDGGVQAYRYARRMALELRPKLHICYLLS